MMIAAPSRTGGGTELASQRLDNETPATRATHDTRPVASSVLLRGHKSITIEHEGVIYRLQVTKLGKLILTK